MEPRRKRPRLELDLHTQSEDDDDELNYDPEEISRKRDPGFRLAQSRATAAFRLKSTFESIFEKYERDFSGVGDEIDLRTGEIVVDNGHLQKMRNEKDVGLDLAEAGKEMPGSASTADEDAIVHSAQAQAQAHGNRRSPRYETSEDEDRILGGDNITGSHEGIINGPMAIVPYASAHRPAHLHTPSNASLYPPPARLGSQPYFGASPLFFNSWTPSGAGDPMWRAPQIEVPRFRSSFATSLYANRYQLPAREGSRSIWAPRPKKGDDEEELDPLPKLRVKASPPTRRVPARPVMAKLIRAHPEPGEDSDDEECILMGAKIDPTPTPRDGQTNSVDNGDTVSLSNGKQTGMEHIETGGSTAQPGTHTQTQSCKEAEGGGGGLTRRTKPRQPRKDHTRRPKTDQLTPAHESAHENRRSSGEPISSDRAAAPIATPSAAATQGASLTLLNNGKRRWSSSVVVELSSSHLFDDGCYLDFSNMSDDSMAQSPHNRPSSSQLSVERDTGDSQNDAPSPPEKVIPDSQTPDSPITESLGPVLDTAVISLRLCSSANDTRQQLAPNAYDLSDEELGFVSKSAKFGKHLPNAKECSGSPRPVDRDQLDDIHIARKRHDEAAIPSMKNVPTDSSPATLFSPIKTRSARARARSVIKTSNIACISAPGADASTTSTSDLKQGPNSLPLTNITPSSGERPSSSHAQPLRSASPLREVPQLPTRGVNEEPQLSDGETNTSASPNILDPAHKIPSHSDNHNPDPQLSQEPTCLKEDRQPPPNAIISQPSAEADTSSSAQVLSKDSNGAASAEPRSKEATKLNSSTSVRSAIQATRQGSRLKSSTTYKNTKKSAKRPSTRQGNGADGHISQVESSPVLQTGKPLAGSSDEPVRQQPPCHLTPTATPRSKMRFSDTTPRSLPSTGHRSLTSLVPEASSAFSANESEDELTINSSVFRTSFSRHVSSNNSISKLTSYRPKHPDSTPTKSSRYSSGSLMSSKLGNTRRLSRTPFVLFNAERPSAPDESVMRTPGGTIRKCGEGGIKCGKDFCFTCC